MKRRVFLQCALMLGAVLSLRTAVATGGAEFLEGKTHVILPPQIRAFIEAKEAQARKDTQAAGEAVAPEVWEFFAAAKAGNADKAGKLWEILAGRSGQYEISSQKAPFTDVRNAAWSPAVEVSLAIQAYANSDAKFCDAFGQGIIKSIPPGAIYFGGTDPGHGLVTALCKSHIDADPFFTLTQNALADGRYMEFLRRMYGAKIHIPTEDETRSAFDSYLKDAAARIQHDKDHPNEPQQIMNGEDIRVIDGKTQVFGQVCVMAINGLIVKQIFDKNPDREFFVEESFALDWMYPYLTPHGLIMRINRTPLDAISVEDVLKDRSFWSHQCKAFLGDWLDHNGRVDDVCDFCERVWLKKNMKGFEGDPAFLKEHAAPAEFSKLRTSQGELYAWRARHAKSDDEKQRMLDEADYAFRQAFAMCPSSQEVVFRYLNLLFTNKRKSDALLIIATAAKADPKNETFKQMQEQIK